MESSRIPNGRIGATVVRAATANGNDGPATLDKLPGCCPLAVSCDMLALFS